MSRHIDFADVISDNTDNSLSSDDGLLSLILHTTIDGRTWQPVVFDGESAEYIDMLASMFVEEYRNTIGLGVDETTCWSMFPKTYRALVKVATDAVKTVAAEQHYAMALV